MMDDLSDHLKELEEKRAKTLPMISLVDNMVKLGSLYKGPQNAPLSHRIRNIPNSNSAADQQQMAHQQQQSTSSSKQHRKDIQVRALMFKVWFINFSIKRMMLILIITTCRKVCDKVVFFVSPLSQKNQALLEELCRIQQTVLVEEVNFQQLKNKYQVHLICSCGCFVARRLVKKTSGGNELLSCHLSFIYYLQFLLHFFSCFVLITFHNPPIFDEYQTQSA